MKDSVIPMRIQPRYITPTHRTAVGPDLQHSALGHGAGASFRQPQGHLTAAPGAQPKH